MSKKSRHNTERRNRLAALRAEVTLTLEDKAKPHHMTYNARKTKQLISDFNSTGFVPNWAGGEGSDFVQNGWKYDDYIDAMVLGQSVTKMVVPST